MPEKTGTLELVARQIGNLLKPLERVLTPATMRDLVYLDLGVEVPSESLAQAAFVSALDQVAVAAGQLSSLLPQLSAAIEDDNEALIFQKTAEAVAQIQTIIAALREVAEQFQVLSTSIPGLTAAQVSGFVKGLPARILELLLIEYIDYFLIRREVLELLGLLEHSLIPVDPGDPTQGFFLYEKLFLKRLGDLFKSPVNHAKAVYDWGEATFNGKLLLERLQKVLSLSGVPARLVPGPTEDQPVLEFILFNLSIDTESLPPGLSLNLKVPIADAIVFSLPLSPSFTLEFSTSGQFDPGLNLLVRPPASLSFLPLQETLRGGIRLQIVGRPVNASELFLLVGQTGGSRLEAGLIKLAFDLTATWDDAAGRARGEVSLEADITDGKLILDTASGGDGFITKFLPPQKMESKFQLGATWTLTDGLRFKGSTGLEVILPVNQSLGPIDFQQIYIGARLDTTGDGIPLEVSGSFSGRLGPLEVTIDRVGFEARLGFPDEVGNLGPIDLGIGFKPPQGIGLAIDAEGISGGGFLRIDPPNYAGAMQLTYRNEIDLTAFGLITTKLPDGRDGFSLLIEILAEFQPIQIGLGFSLTGVGGLIGINRQLNEEGMRSAFKTHALDTILFPQSPIRDAVKIIEALQAIMPPREDYHILGPMAELFWGGSMRLVEFKVGVFIQLGGPLKIIVLGQAWSYLPTDDNPRLVLNVDVLGIIDFGEERLAFDATLYDSRILNYTLDGKMALRADWSSGEENFALSVGGFHPRFQQVPPGFPQLTRLLVAVGSDNPKLTLCLYLAITPNTLQIGAQIDLWAKKLGFTITGGASFDALFTFAPFAFLIIFNVWVNIKKSFIDLGVWLELELSGPNPIIAAGYAKFKVGFFTKKIRFRAEFGEKIPEPLPVVSTLAALMTELANPRSLRFQLPAWTSANLIFTQDAEGKVDPIADVIIIQNAVPLNFTIERFGGGIPQEAEQRLSITIGLDTGKEKSVQSNFAAEQFKNWSEDERLSARPFEKYDAGISFSGEYVIPESHQEKRQIAFETVLRESQTYREQLPKDDHRYLAVRTTCIWQVGVVEAALLNNWSLFGSRRFFNPVRQVKDASKPNYIKVIKPEFSLALNEAKDGKFIAAGIEGVERRKMTYAEALEVRQRMKDPKILIRDKVDVTSV